MQPDLLVFPSFIPQTLPDWLLARLEAQARDPNTEITHLLGLPAGAHPHLVATNPTLLLDAISNPSTFIRPRPIAIGGLTRLAQHRDLPSEILRLLLTSEHPRVAAAATKNPTLTPELTEHAIRRLNVQNLTHAPKHIPTRKQIHDALYRRLPIERARELTLEHLEHEDEPLPATLTHPHQSFEEALDFYQHAYALGKLDVYQLARASAALIKHPQAPEAFLLDAESSPFMSEWIALAEAPAATPGMLRRHARRLLDRQQLTRQRHDRKHPNEHPLAWPDRALTALSTRTDLPPEAIEHLCEEGPGHVRVNLAENPITPPQFLEELARDPNEDVRLAATRHPHNTWNHPPDYTHPANITGMIQHRQLDDASRFQLLELLEGTPWLKYLAKSPHTPKSIHQHFLNHPTAALQAAAISNPHTSIHDLLKAGDSPYITVRVAATNHYATPDALLMALCKSQNDTVKKAATKAFERNLKYGRNPNPDP